MVIPGLRTRRPLRWRWSERAEGPRRTCTVTDGLFSLSSRCPFRSETTKSLSQQESKLAKFIECDGLRRHADGGCILPPSRRLLGFA